MIDYHRADKIELYGYIILKKIICIYIYSEKFLETNIKTLIVNRLIS